MRSRWAWAIPGAVALAAASPALAQARLQRSFSQYNARAWHLVDGAPPDIWALAQSPDGWLWLGTGAGLYRFDGIRFEPVSPKIGRYPSRNITALLPDPDGSLWIGYFSGQVSRLRGTRLDTFGQGNAAVEELARGRDGTIWAALSGPQGGLLRISGGRATRIGADHGVPPGRIYSVVAARDGAVWITSARDIRVRRPGASRFEPVHAAAPHTRLAEAPDGIVWASGGAGPAASRAVPGLAIALQPPGLRSPGADRIGFDSTGTLWRTLYDGGVLQTRGLPGAPVHTRLGLQQGLPSLVAVPLLEDREANLWVGTNLGLVRLRPVSATVALGVDDQTLGGFQLAVLPDGTVYAANPHTLYRARPGEPLSRLRHFSTPIEQIEADGADLVVALPDRFLRVRGDAISPLPVPPPPGAVRSWSRSDGTVWITVEDLGVFHLAAGRWRHFGARNRPADRLHTASGAGGGSWFYGHNRLYRRQGEALVAVPGDDIGAIALVSAGPAGLLIGGELGLARLEQGRLRAIDTARAPVLGGITGLAQARDGTVWINGVQGLVRTNKPALDAAFHHARTPLAHRLFTAADGLPGVAQQDAHRSTAVRGGDGRIWVADNVGIGWMDPAGIVHNPLPPPVVIRSVTANGRAEPAAGPIALPAGTANLRIAYTALSLAQAERVRFRYRLVGVDRDWVEAGTAREAYYANLGPGRMRFQVIAANNDGVWNTTGASVDFTIAPRFYQTGWFRLLAIGLGAGTLWLLYAWRMRELMARGRARAEAKIAERERIARELHDTLLQSMQGLMLRFQAAAYATDPGSRAHQLLDSALDRADDVMVEARNRVMALRSIVRAGDPQPLIEELARCLGEEGLAVSVTREGPPLRYAPAQLEQLLAIVQEALANVRRHAGVTKAAVALRTGRRTLEVEIRDAGPGIPADILAAGGRPGHYGLQGMRERAQALGGTLTIERCAPSGTVVRLTLPK
ncbi:sensor histidine kinase [Sphingomonas sp. R1]|uniref:sensor histidine kinase n=1 Tax=Sphingomonas sp. R1 TaxID=399176 RepID=UPI002224B76E|nr:sensor histidine kinase [Sphingomonas sp. R1]UYY77226.1 histidine kinase [Sphingomonas sp. R1]